MRLLVCFCFNNYSLIQKATIGIRFQSIGVKNTEENRRAYRQMLFSTDNILSKYISGIIVHPETLDEATDDGKSMISLITVSYLKCVLKAMYQCIIMLG